MTRRIHSYGQPYLWALLVVTLCTSASNLAAQDTDSPVPYNIAFAVGYEHTLRSDELLFEDITKTYKNGIDVQRNYFEQLPLADLTIEGGSACEGANGFGIAGQVKIKPEWKGNYFCQTNLPIANGEASVEGNLFSRSVVYWKSPSFGIAFGRDQVDYNGILEGGLLASARLPWLDALRGYGILGRFRLDSMIATIPAVKAWDNNDITPEPGYGFETETDATTIVEAMSKIGWNFGPEQGPGMLTLSLADHAMLARYQNRFYLTDFFPFISRHQASIPQTNNSMVISLHWQPFPWMQVAGQAGYDDINLNPVGVSDTGTPTIDAYAVAMNLNFPLRKSTVFDTENQGLHSDISQSLEVYLEGGYTHWLWGNYDGHQAHPNDANYFLRFIYRYKRYLGGSILLPLTSPYGPGVVWVQSHGTFNIEGKLLNQSAHLALGYRFLFLDMNSEANLIDTEVYDNATTEEAARSYAIRVSLPVSLTYGSIFSTIEPAYLWRDGLSAFELDLSIAWRFDVSSGSGL